MGPEIVEIIKAIILPPGFNLVLVIVAILLLPMYKRISRIILIFSILTLYVFSTPLFARIIASTIEPANALDIKQPVNRTNTALVILGCGRYSQPVEYTNDDISACSLIRLRYAAEIYPSLQIPILISGGRVFDEPEAESAIMGRILKEKFNIPVTWLETKSRNTIENATYSAPILKENNIETVYLLSHALHMKRATYLFEHNGFKVIQAPTYFYSTRNFKPGWIGLLPNAEALTISQKVFKEFEGIIWQNLIL